MLRHPLPCGEREEIAALSSSLGKQHWWAAIESPRAAPSGFSTTIAEADSISAKPMASVNVGRSPSTIIAVMTPITGEEDSERRGGRRQPLHDPNQRK